MECRDNFINLGVHLLISEKHVGDGPSGNCFEKDVEDSAIGVYDFSEKDVGRSGRSRQWTLEGEGEGEGKGKGAGSREENLTEGGPRHRKGFSSQANLID